MSKQLKHPANVGICSRTDENGKHARSHPGTPCRHGLSAAWTTPETLRVRRPVAPPTVPRLEDHNASHANSSLLSCLLGLHAHRHSPAAAGGGAYFAIFLVACTPPNTQQGGGGLVGTYKVASRAPKRVEWDSTGLHPVSCSTAADTWYCRADGAVTGLANVCLDAPPNVCTSMSYERSGTLGRAALTRRVGP